MTGELTLVTLGTCEGWMQAVETGLTTSDQQHEGEFLLKIMDGCLHAAATRVGL